MRIRDFQFTARTRLDIIDRLENGVVININSGHGEIAEWLLGLFDNTDDAVTFDFRYAETFWVRDFSQYEMTIGLITLEFFDKASDTADDYIIAEIKNKRFVANERLGNPDAIG